MRAYPNRSDGLLRGLTAAMACGLLAGCATGSTPTPTAASEVGVFKAEYSGISGAVAPSPHAGWYIQRGPVRYNGLGMATWRRMPAHSGLTAWLSRLFHRKAAGAGDPAAYAAADSSLPVPSIVEVTNLRSGETVRVRVDDRAPMRGYIISLGPLAARALGADPTKPIPVRVRYVEPAITYRQTPTLRYALAGARKPAPVAPPPAALAQALRPEAPLPPAPKAPEVIKVVQTLPVARTMEPAPPPPAEPAASPPRAAEPFPAGAWRIQAGAFAKEANARRAVAMLAPAGAASIEPMKRGALTLYRVVLRGPRDEHDAKALRAKVAEIGFRDAELIRPL